MLETKVTFVCMLHMYTCKHYFVMETEGSIFTHKHIQLLKISVIGRHRGRKEV